MNWTWIISELLKVGSYCIIIAISYFLAKTAVTFERQGYSLGIIGQSLMVIFFSALLSAAIASIGGILGEYTLERNIVWFVILSIPALIGTLVAFGETKLKDEETDKKLQELKDKGVL